VVGQIIDDPLLVEMLFCPLLFYGSASEHDMEFGPFSILFRSIFEEGMARPRAGVRRILKRLVRRFKELGGELRLRAGVSRIAVREAAVEKVVLDDGTELAAHRVLSSAGWRETARLCDLAPPGGEPPAGRIAFVESISSSTASPGVGPRPHDGLFQRCGAFDYACRPTGRPPQRRDLLAEQFRLRSTAALRRKGRCASRRWPISTAGLP
jgi:phytoene dehydrogenase-like protein